MGIVVVLIVAIIGLIIYNLTIHKKIHSKLWILDRFINNNK